MRLIDADKLREKLDDLGWTTENGFDKRVYLDDIVDNAPTVELENKYNIGFYDGFMSAKENIEKEPEKVKEGELIKAYTKGFDAGVETVRPQGEWIFTDNRWGLGNWECDSCHEYSNINSNFCPKCGADMRGDNDDG